MLSCFQVLCGLKMFENLSFCVSLDVTHDQSIFGHVKKSYQIIVVWFSLHSGNTPLQTICGKLQRPGDYFEFHLEYSCWEMGSSLFSNGVSLNVVLLSAWSDDQCVLAYDNYSLVSKWQQVTRIHSWFHPVIQSSICALINESILTYFSVHL